MFTTMTSCFSLFLAVSYRVRQFLHSKEANTLCPFPNCPFSFTKTSTYVIRRKRRRDLYYRPFEMKNQ